jgi:hypothetical protein
MPYTWGIGKKSTRATQIFDLIKALKFFWIGINIDIARSGISLWIPSGLAIVMLHPDAGSHRPGY